MKSVPEGCGWAYVRLLGIIGVEAARATARAEAARAEAARAEARAEVVRAAARVAAMVGAMVGAVIGDIGRADLVSLERWSLRP